jgi:hypothetical protein
MLVELVRLEICMAWSIYQPVNWLSCQRELRPALRKGKVERGALTCFYAIQRYPPSPSLRFAPLR